MDLDSRDKILFSAAFVLFSIVCLWATSSGTHEGYELSIYPAFGKVFWGLVVFSYVFGFLIITSGVTQQRYAWSFVGLGLSGAVTILLHNLWLFRGYVFAGFQDLQSSLGNVHHILNTGTLVASDFYPVLELNITAVSLASSLRPRESALLYTTVSFATFLFGVYVLAARQRNIALGLFASYLAALPTFKYVFWSNYPAGISLSLIPMGIYALERQSASDPRWRWVYCVIGLCLTVYHPITLGFLLIISATFVLLRYQRAVSSSYRRIPLPLSGKTIVPILTVVLILASTWYFNFDQLVDILSAMIGKFLVGPEVEQAAPRDHTSILARIMSLLGRADLSPSGFLKLFFFRYGDFAVLFVVTGLFTLRTAARRFQSQIDTTYSAYFAATMALSMTALLGQSIIFGINRLFRVPIFLASLIAGIVLTRCFNGNGYDPLSKPCGSPALRAIVASILVLFVVVSAVFGVYPSPIQADNNQMTSQSSVSVTNYMIDHLDDPVLMDKYKLRYTEYYLHEKRGLSGDRMSIGTDIEDSFGYSESITHLRQKNNMAGRFLVIGTLDLEYHRIYTEYRNEPPKFSENDVRHLNADSSVNRVYANGEFGLWNIAE